MSDACDCCGEDWSSLSVYVGMESESVVLCSGCEARLLHDLMATTPLVELQRRVGASCDHEIEQEGEE